MMLRLTTSYPYCNVACDFDEMNPKRFCKVQHGIYLLMQLDEDEKYLSKLEAGLYTLQASSLSASISSRPFFVC